MASEHTVWDKLTAIGTLVLAITAVVALWYADAQIRESRYLSEAQIKESRNQAQLQHLDELVQRFENGSLLAARVRLAQLRVDEKHETLRPLKPDDEPAEMDTILDFFDYVGLLERRGFLDKSDVWDQFGFYLLAFHADAQQVITEAQKHEEANWENVASLVKDVQEVDVRREHGALSKETTQDDLYNFYEGETAIKPGQPIPQANRKK